VHSLARPSTGARLNIANLQQRFDATQPQIRYHTESPARTAPPRHRDGRVVPIGTQPVATVRPEKFTLQPLMEQS
jgi:hypothetical protein